MSRSALDLYSKLPKIRKGKRYVLFITGDLASGKSEAAKRVERKLKEQGVPCSIISLDSFLKDRAYRHAHPEAERYKLLLLDQLQTIRERKSIKIPLYDYRSGRADSIQTLSLEDTIIIEGGLYTHALDLAPLCDEIVFIAKKPLPIFVRLIKRDMREKGYSLVKCLRKYLWTRRDFREYIAPYLNKATVVIPTYKIL